MLGKLIAKKAGRPKRRRGPKPKPKPAVAKKAPVRKKPAKVVRSPKENAELKRLISSQKRDDAPDSNPLPRRRATGPKGSKPVEQGPLLSKVQLPEKMSKAQARKLIMQGKAKVRTDKNGKKKLVSTGEYAPARGVVAEEMGLSKRGKLPSEAELKEIGGFEMRNKGGKVKRKAGGKVKGYKKGGPLKAESFENMKEVERGKMRKTIQNIKGTPAEIAKDRKRKKIKKPTILPDYGDELYETPNKNSETEAQIARMIKGAFDKPKPIRPSKGAKEFTPYLKRKMPRKKGGGTIKRRMGGKVRGYGKAQRGY
mgnify:CR=1 FL=1